MKQLVDWRAALLAGLLAGTVHLLLVLFVVPAMQGGNAWVMLRLLASVVLGQSVLIEAEAAHAGALVIGIAVHYLFSISFTLLVAFVLHRWGLIVGVLGGAAFGLALYAINIYGMTLFVQQFVVMRSMPFLAVHLVFGALAGGIYELLEVERFVPEGKEAH